MSALSTPIMPRSPAKLPQTIYQEGMTVMFVNIMNYRCAAFVMGKLRSRVPDVDEAAFDVVWLNGKLPEGIKEDYEDLPVILDGIDKEDEISFRTYVLEARLVAYGAAVRDTLSLNEVMIPLDHQRELLGLQRPSGTLTTQNVRLRIENLNARTLTNAKNKSKEETALLPMELFNEILIEATPKVKEAMKLEEEIKKTPDLAQ